MSSAALRSGLPSFSSLFRPRNTPENNTPENSYYSWDNLRYEINSSRVDDKTFSKVASALEELHLYMPDSTKLDFLGCVHVAGHSIKPNRNIIDPLITLIKAKIIPGCPPQRFSIAEFGPGKTTDLLGFIMLHIAPENNRSIQDQRILNFNSHLRPSAIIQKLLDNHLISENEPYSQNHLSPFHIALAKQDDSALWVNALIEKEFNPRISYENQPSALDVALNSSNTSPEVLIPLLDTLQLRHSKKVLSEIINNRRHYKTIGEWLPNFINSQVKYRYDLNGNLVRNNTEQMCDALYYMVKIPIKHEEIHNVIYVLNKGFESIVNSDAYEVDPNAHRTIAKFLFKVLDAAIQNKHIPSLQFLTSRGAIQLFRGNTIPIEPSIFTGAAIQKLGSQMIDVIAQYAIDCNTLSTSGNCFAVNSANAQRVNDYINVVKQQVYAATSVDYSNTSHNLIRATCLVILAINACLFIRHGSKILDPESAFIDKITPILSIVASALGFMLANDNSRQPQIRQRMAQLGLAFTSLRGATNAANMP